MKTLIGEQIRRLRETRRITQEEISTALGMTRQRFARIEKGHSDISYETIIAIAKYLDIDSHEITRVCESTPPVSFRNGNAHLETFEKIEELISFFYANKSLYVKMNSESDDDL